MVWCENARLAGVFVFGLILLLAGCAAPQTRQLQQDSIGPRQVELDKVVFHPQEEYQCGPAALATVLEAAGRRVSPDALVPLVYVPQRQGSFQVEMLAAARRYGTVAMEVAPRLKDLLAEVAAGNPVVVLQNLGLSWAPQWHYAVVVGYDLERGTAILRSGQYRRLETKLSVLERTWARSRYWAMLALPSDRLPPTASENRYVSAAFALEQVGQPRAARAAYNTALRAWPNNLTAHIGLGNIAYKFGELPTAEQVFRRAAQLHPESVVALNNLANVLADLRRWDEAKRTAQRALALGGAHREVVAQTLREIEERSRGVRREE